MIGCVPVLPDSGANGAGGPLPGASVPGALVESALLLLVVGPRPGSPASKTWLSCSSAFPTLLRP